MNANRSHSVGIPEPDPSWHLLYRIGGISAWIFVVEVGHSRYLVSPYGESDWVRNLRTAGQGELSSKGQTEVFHASEVPVDERGDIIAKYREVAGSHIGPYFTKLPDPKDHPVFRVA